MVCDTFLSTTFLFVLSKMEVLKLNPSLYIRFYITSLSLTTEKTVSEYPNNLSNLLIILYIS